ncbi:MAG: thiol:disulfide interchange protein DsbA/DsbL [Burkholderiaceae bacterium]
MKRREFTVAAAVAALPGLLALPAHAQSDKTYKTLDPRAPVDAPPGQIEVVEFFSYGCSHCMHFEPIMDAWVKTLAKDVAFRRVHVGFQSSFAPLQKIFYTLEAMGKVDGAMQDKVFKALQTERVNLTKPEVLFPWAAKQGLDQAKFESTYNSFGVATQLRKAVQLQDAYKVEGTPALGIAGRYYTDASLSNGFEPMIKLANQLIEQVRKGA